MDIIEKIDELRKERGWSIYKLSLESGVAQSTLATMRQRKTPLKIDSLQCICEAFEITLAQFFLEDENVEILSEQESTLIEKYRALPAEKRNAILSLIS